jgi:hypothetical protein
MNTSLTKELDSAKVRVCCTVNVTCNKERPKTKRKSLKIAYKIDHFVEIGKK